MNEYLPSEKMVMHTPGPWRIANDDETKKHLATDGYCFLEAKEGHYSKDVDTGFSITGYMGLANAKLIAAAPDLLQALKECEQTLARAVTGEPTLAGYALSQARAAIEKATA